MKAGVWEDLGRIECREWPEPDLSPETVLVSVGACGFCGSDPHIIEGNLRVGRPPQVLGHEVAGEVVAVGEAVAGIEVGTRVACNPYAYCGSCAWCRAGQADHCRRKFFSARGFAELAVYKPEQLFTLPSGLSTSQGAFLEPVAVALHAVDVSELRAGEHVAVLGAGALGLIVAQVARAAGARTVVVSEPRPFNRDLALMLGADQALDPTCDDLAGMARAVGDRGGFDVVFEVAGAPSALEIAPNLVSVGGRVVIVGVFDREVTVPLNPLLLFEKEIAVRGTFSYGRTFPRALQMLSRLALDPLVTVAPLSDIADVYERHRRGEFVKVQVAP